MKPNNDKYNIEAMDKNIQRLLISARSPGAAAVSFKQNLLLRLKEELARFAKRESRKLTDSTIFEENLGRLIESSEIETEEMPSFKDRLRYQLIAASEAEQRKRRLSIWAPALATAAVIVLLLMGFVIHPNFWADRGVSIAAAMDQGTAVVTQTKHLFFNWGTTYVEHSIASGDTFSLAAGDKIMTGPDSTAVLELFNDSTLKLYPGSQLYINELEAANEQGSPVVAVKLETGKANVEINDFTYEMETPSALATVMGTAFRVEVIATDHTYLATSEGIVQLTMGEYTVQVPAGQEVDAIEGKPLVVKQERSPNLTITSPDTPEVNSASITLSGETDVGASVTVNGVPVSVDPNGSFSTKLSLEFGPNDVSVIATSPSGKTITIDMIITRV